MEVGKGDGAGFAVGVDLPGVLGEGVRHGGLPSIGESGRDASRPFTPIAFRLPNRHRRGEAMSVWRHHDMLDIGRTISPLALGVIL